MKPYLQGLLGDDDLGTFAADLATAALDPGTYATYGSAIRPFFQFCEEQRIHPLSVTAVEICRYVAWQGIRGSVAAKSLQQYLSAINKFLADHGYEPTALGALVASVRRGLSGAQIDLDPADVRIALPPEAIVAFIAGAKAIRDALPRWSAPATPRILLFRAFLACAVNFLFFQRGEAGTACRTGDLLVHPGGIHLFCNDYKGARGVAPVRKPVHNLPVSAFADLADLLRYFDAQRAAWQGGAQPAARWAVSDSEAASTWSADTLTEWLRLACDAAGFVPPDGFKWTSHSLRKGAATAAYAINVPLLKIKFMGNWAQESLVVHRYIDVTAQPTPAAWQLFGWLVPGRQPAASGRPVA